MSKYMMIGLISAMSAMAYRAEAVEGNTGGSAATINAANPVTAPDPSDPTKPLPAAVADKATQTPELTAEQKAKQDADKAVLFDGIKAKFNNLVDIRETNFSFRTVKNEVKNDDGTKSTIETKRPTVALPVPVPSLEGIIDILGKGPGKEVDLLLEAVTAVILEQAREYINEHEEVNADNFPYEMLSWEKIANLPKAERRGGGISKEVWEDFAKDYVEIMPAVTGKKKESVEMAAKVFVSKFAGATTNKPVLNLLRAQLALYATNTTQGEQFAPCIEFLMNKLDKLLNTDETNLLLAL